MNSGTDKAIDVKNVFLSKNPGLGRLLPGFVFRWIEKTIHQDEMNEIYRRIGHLQGIDFARAVIRDFNISVHIFGEENLPLSGRVLFAGNHPLGGFDGLVLLTAIGEKYGSVKFLVNDILMNIKNLESVFLPVNKHGPHSKHAAEKIHESFSSEIPVITFPAGLCSRKIKGNITDLPWKNNFIKKAVTYKRDVVPFYVDARNSNFFYNLSNFRKKIGVKVNVEMFFLPDEMFKFRNKEITFYFGKPIPYAVFDKSCSLDQWTEYVRNVVYTLKK